MELAGLSASGEWVEAPASSQPYGAANFELGGQALLTQVSSGLSATFRLTWPDGSSRDLGPGYPTLSRDGRLQLRTAIDPLRFEVQESVTGQVVATYGNTWRVIDGDWLWTLTSAGELHGADLTGERPDRSVALGLPCAGQAGSLGAVRGDRALRYCANTATSFIDDLTGAVPRWTVPGLPFPDLGRGFVAWIDESTFGEDKPSFLLGVSDLTAQHLTRTFGPVVNHAGTTIFAADSGDNAGFVWIDPDRLIHHATVDVAAPTLEPASGSPTFVSQVGATLTYSYGATDDLGVSGYDVAVRSAPSGGTLGAWSTGWTDTSSTTQSVTAPPGSQWCFRFRAHDAVGHVTGWSPPRCSSVPVDDRAMKGTGAVARLVGAGCLEQTFTKLHGRGASLTLSGQTGRAVGVWVVRGPGQGVAELRAGSQALGRINLSAPTWHRALVVRWAPQPWSGSVSITQVGWKPVRIDALAVVR